MSDPDSHEIKEVPSAQAEFDTIVAHVELTLIAIIQGVALTFLVERSYDLLVGFRVLFWPTIFLSSPSLDRRNPSGMEDGCIITGIV